MKMDTEAIKDHIRGLIIALGEDPNREGLKDTPNRVAKMYEQIFEGINYSNDEIAQMFDKTFEEDTLTDSKNVVIIRDIDIFSCCEHHLALMYDMNVTVAYIPNGKVIGLSKIARVCDMVGKRLQLQERIGKDIAYIIQKISNSKDVAVLIKGKHSCMTMRGIKKNNSITETAILQGKFKDDYTLQNKLYSRI
ncbi:GTP cyclohydrolase I FolE [Fusobacterium hominis]|uniref:GTP cyclohydrolase 1 n=2 Tax=Fusobacterium hominis TaxID=2764326 RepID=A0A7G9GZN1_9FUSO|nr:GTP cyclohydrolase I FolE [Fusobacterium hominis]